LRPPERQTALLLFPRKGIVLERFPAAAAFLSSLSLKA
jgi:hypothetical protein